MPITAPPRACEGDRSGPNSGERQTHMSSKQNPVCWFEIPVKDMVRAKAFYEHVFGVKLEVNKMGAMTMAFFTMQDGSYGTAGALLKARGRKPAASGVLLYFSTPDINAALKRAGKKGGRTVMAKTDIGEYGVIGVFKDSEGNRIGLHAMK
jgi:uncharacterized protein